MCPFVKSKKSVVANFPQPKVTNWLLYCTGAALSLRHFHGTHIISIVFLCCKYFFFHLYQCFQLVVFRPILFEQLVQFHFKFTLRNVVCQYVLSREISNHFPPRTWVTRNWYQRGTNFKHISPRARG
jgi:hypothetical protein